MSLQNRQMTWVVWDHSQGETEEDAVAVMGVDAEDAAETWADKHLESEDETATVIVKLHQDFGKGGPEHVFTVTSELTIVYSATEVKSG